MRDLLFFCLLIGITTAACQKKKQEPARHVNTFSAEVNGTTFIPSNIELFYGGSSIPGAKQVNVEAKASNGHAVTIIMSDYDGTLKTFRKNLGAYSIAPGLTNSSYSINGEINITSIDKTTYSNGEIVGGNFQFDTDSTAGKYFVRNGRFSVYVKR